jgi:DUF971 family protein
MPSPIDLRKKPASVKIHVSTGKGVDITWGDGHASHYDFIYLRENCPCASCDDERNKKAVEPPAPTNATAPTASGVLPMYKPKPGARSAQPVGHYAIKIDFTDGHSTGIFSYDYLRTNCPCEDCARDFRGN